MLMILIIDGEIQAFNKWNSFDIANITAYSNLQYRCHINHTSHEMCFNGLKVAFICFFIWDIFPPTFTSRVSFSSISARVSSSSNSLKSIYVLLLLPLEVSRISYSPNFPQEYLPFLISSRVSSPSTPPRGSGMSFSSISS